MIGKLLIVFVLIPLADLMLLLMVSRVVGFWGTLLLVVASGALGVVLFRWQVRLLTRSAQSGDALQGLPQTFLSDGLLIFLGAALLVAPGLITDMVGLSLLIPWTRRWHQRKLFAWLMGQGRWTILSQSYQVDDVVEGEVVDRSVEDGAP